MYPKADCPSQGNLLLVFRGIEEYNWVEIVVNEKKIYLKKTEVHVDFLAVREVKVSFRVLYSKIQ